MKKLRIPWTSFRINHLYTFLLLCRPLCTHSVSDGLEVEKMSKLKKWAIGCPKKTQCLKNPPLQVFFKNITCQELTV